jgi:hypothetical protein
MKAEARQDEMNNVNKQFALVGLQLAASRESINQ